MKSVIPSQHRPSAKPDQAPSPLRALPFLSRQARKCDSISHEKKKKLLLPDLEPFLLRFFNARHSSSYSPDFCHPQYLQQQDVLYHLFYLPRLSRPLWLHGDLVGPP
jgi:hypothetical protein